jgi:tripartite-type tricarboxylate transporter receptor subunit TctC
LLQQELETSMQMHRRGLIQAGLALAGAATMGSARAASWPERPVRIIVPFAPGGGVDVSARMLADQLRTVWGGSRSAFVDNKPGANTIIAATAALSAPKDEHTFLATINLTRQLPFLGQKLAFDPQADFIPVGAITVEQLVLVVNAKSGVRSFEDWLRQARTSAKGVNFGTFALGSLAHLTAAQIGAQLNIPTTVVHYRGAAPAVQALLAGEIDVTVSNLGTVQQHIASGKLTALAVTGAKRYSLTPELPTLKERGVSDLDFVSWIGLFAPAGTAQATVNKMGEDMRAALQAPELVKKINAFAQEPGQYSPAEFQALLQDDDRMALKLIKAYNIRLDG